MRVILLTIKYISCHIMTSTQIDRLRARWSFCLSSTTQPDLTYLHLQTPQFYSPYQPNPLLPTNALLSLSSRPCKHLHVLLPTPSPYTSRSKTLAAPHY